MSDKMATVRGCQSAKKTGGTPSHIWHSGSGGAEVVSSFVKRHGIGGACSLQFNDLRRGVREGGRAIALNLA